MEVVMVNLIGLSDSVIKKLFQRLNELRIPYSINKSNGHVRSIYMSKEYSTIIAKLNTWIEEKA